MVTLGWHSSPGRVAHPCGSNLKLRADDLQQSVGSKGVPSVVQMLGHCLIDSTSTSLCRVDLGVSLILKQIRAKLFAFSFGLVMVLLSISRSGAGWRRCVMHSVSQLLFFSVCKKFYLVFYLDKLFLAV